MFYIIPFANLLLSLQPDLKKKNHGLLVATASIEATVRYFTLLEKNCHTQLLADAAGAPIKIGDYEAEDTYKTVGTISGGWFSGRPMFQQLEKEEGVRFSYGLK